VAADTRAIGGRIPTIGQACHGKTNVVVGGGMEFKMEGGLRTSKV
jgi:hypothetical protein